ncbi:fused (3R)-hydroxyacyl-ACP dehydratase subunits HadA/HadB [Nocardia neocaledoniensis]|nr:fused (3R)-hydroxyacyl-ACP dehydratase subunits HadA/HadB [Nocardia neocaledoniensis]
MATLMMPSDLDAPALSVDPADAVGCSYHCADRYVVGREKIREFARAVQDGHQAHWSESAAGELGHPGLVAPPTFTSVPAFLAQIAMFDHVAHGYDMSQIMQTDYVVAFGKPVVAGDELTFAVHFESFRRAFGGDIFRFRCEAVDGHGELCLTTWTTFVGRPDVDTSAARACAHVMMQNVRQAAPARRAHAPAEAPREPRITAVARGHIPADAIAVGDELPTRTATLTPGDLVNYAGVAGDPNPIHWSRDAAAAAGLKAPVAQGMLTIGLGAAFLTAWTRDPGALREYAVRLTSPVYVDDAGGSIEFTGRVKSVDRERRTATVALAAHSAGKKIFGRATATIGLGD